MGARADRRGPRPGLRQERLSSTSTTSHRGPTPTTASAASPPVATSPSRAASSSSSKGTTRPRLGGKIPAGHQGGAIHFGADGKLYVAIGEQTAGAPSQGWTTLQGKLLRLNPDGSIPEDNPFYSNGPRQIPRDLGTRPAQSVHASPSSRAPGRIFINDVGENRWEEIDEGFAGRNYGWPAAEGPTTDPRFRGPIHHYPVASVAGGAFCPTGSGRGVPSQSIAASISSWTSSRAGSRSSTPITRSGWRRSPAG